VRDSDDEHEDIQ